MTTKLNNLKVLLRGSFFLWEELDNQKKREIIERKNKKQFYIKRNKKQKGHKGCQ